MPKVKLAEISRRGTPPIDWLWAAVLERKMVYHYDLREMAQIAGVSYETMRRYIKISPWEWGKTTREKMCKGLGIKLIETVDGSPIEREVEVR